MSPGKRSSNRLRSALALAALSNTIGIDSAFAQSGGTWTYNGNDLWSTGTVWFDSTVPFGADNVAAFGIGGAGVNILDTLTVTLETSRTIGSLSFGDGDAVNTPAGWLLRPLSNQTLTLQVQPGSVPGLNVNPLGTGNGTSSIGTLFQKIAHVNVGLSGTQGFQKTGTGTAVLSGNNSGLSGSIQLFGGILVANSPTALGGVNLISHQVGQLALRGDTALNFSGVNVVLQGDSTLGTGNSIGTNGLYGTGSNLVHTLGDITMDSRGQFSLGISGSNGYGLTIGRLNVRDGVNLVNQGNAGNIAGAGDSNGVNGLGSGQLTVGTITYTGAVVGTISMGGVGSYAGNITVTNGLTQTGGASASLVYTGSRTATLSGTIGTDGDTYIRGGTTGTTTLGNFQAGVGTLVVGAGALPSNRAVTINGGTLVLNGGALTHNISGITMGGATLTSGAVPAFINTGSGTVALGGGGIVVDNSVLFNTGNTTTSVNATAGGISGRLDLGGTSQNVAVHGISTLTVDAIVNGAGGIIKTGTGALILNNVNTFTGAIDVVDGVVAGRVHAVGNSLGSLGANVSLGGAIRLNGSSSAGTGTVNTLTSKDTGIHPGLIVDATAGGATTLNVNIFGGREANTRGTIKVVPVTGSLNVNEIVNLSTGAPTTTNGILPAYIAVQNSGTNTALGFASLSSNRIVAFNSYQVGDINAASTVYDLASGSQTVSGGGKTLFAARIGGSASVTGGALTLGNSTTGFGGLILNGDALLSTSTLQPNSTDELVIWSGGAGTNSITSHLNLTGDLTTGGSQALAMSGTLNLNATTRNVSVTGATVTLSATSALGNTGNLVKRGGGVLVVAGSNTGFTGTIGIQSGTLQLGNGGAFGDVGTALGNAITNNSNLLINRNSAITYSNAISGTGDMWVNSSGAIVTFAGPLTYTGRTTIQAGTVRISGNDGIPAGTALRVDSGATFDVNGFAQSMSSLNGAGTIINNLGGTRTLTINNGGTFTGGIRSGVGNLALVKNGPGTLSLTGPNTYGGTITVNSGTFQINSSGAGATGTMILNNSAFALNIIPTNGGTSNLTNAATIFSGNTTISVVSNPVIVLTGGGSLAGSNFVRDGQGPGLFAAAGYTWTGGGTVNLVLGGRMLNIGPSGFTAASNPLFMTNFSGTLKWDDGNSPGSRTRFALGNSSFTTGSQFATFNFGNGDNIVNLRNGSVEFNIGFVSGGTNTIIEGCENGIGRTTDWAFGWLPGNQTYHGQIRDLVTPEGNGINHVSKFGSSSTLTLKNTMTFTGGISLHAGTLFLASGANIANAGSIVTNGGTLSILPGAVISSNRIFATSTAGVGGGINVGSFPGFSTPAGLNFIGGGTVYGNVNHNAGSINPGAVSGFGTLTFANNLQMAGGAMDFDTSAGSSGIIGNGANDLLRISAAAGLDLTSGTLRLNFFNGTIPAGNTPPPSLAPGQFYPIISYSGTYTGALTNMFTTAKFRGSFNLEQGSGSLANTLGARVIAIGGATNSLVWQPVAPQNNYWDAAVGFQNWKPLGGSGSLFFFNGDTVTFDDTAPITSGNNNRIVQITPGLAPTSITVNTSGNYIFTGTGFGSIIGSTSITKNGSGTLYIAGNNSFTGGITVNGGTLVTGDPSVPLLVPNALGGGTATTTFNNNSNFQFISPLPNTFSGPGGAGGLAGGNFVFNEGYHRVIGPFGGNQNHPWNINMFGTGTVAFERLPSVNLPTINFFAPAFASFAGTLKITDSVVLGGDGTILRPDGGGNPSMSLDLGTGPSGGGLVLNASGQTFTVGALRGGPNTSLKLGANGQTGTFVVGHNTLSSTFHGVFKATTAVQGPNLSPNSVVHVIKNGSGSTLTLTQIQPYLGNTTINAGTLALVNGVSNPFVSPLITIGTAGVMDVSGLSGGAGNFVLNGDQRLISNGNVVGTSVQAVSTSTVGGTSFGIPLIVDDGATIAPGNSVGTLTVSNLTLQGSADFLIEVDQSGIDSVVLSGIQTAAIVNAQSSLNLVNLGGFVPGTYTFLDYDGDPDVQGSLEDGFVPLDFGYEVKVLHDTVNTKVLLQFVNNLAQWFVNNDGSWSTASNWTLDGTNPAIVVPNSITFGTFISAPRTVTVNSTIGNTANSIVFDSPHGYTIAGTGTLTLDAGAVTPVTVLQGNHSVNTPVRALRTLGLSVASTSTISFGGTVINANNAGINKIGTGTASFVRLSMPGGSLNVGAGKVVMSAKPTNNSVAGTNLLAGMTISPGATVDLTNNAMILDYTGAIGGRLTELRAELADGRLFSSTAGATHAVGYRNNDTGTTAGGGTGTAGLGLGQQTTFAGVAADTTSVIIRVTYKGDSNLDGIVNILDLYNLSLNWLSANGVWAGGDFNFDGSVNQADLGLLAINWQQGNNNPLPGEDLGAALTAAGIPLSAVPEPCTLALAGVGAMGLLTRRRRRA